MDQDHSSSSASSSLFRWDKSPRDAEEHQAPLAEASEDELVEVVRYTFWPKLPGGTFRDGRPCQQQYSRCKAFPVEGQPPRLAGSLDPLDDADVRALLAENMGW